MYGPRRFLRTITFARPADTTQYAAGDSVADNATTHTASTFVLPGVAPTHKMGGTIRSVVLHKDAVAATGADFDVYFFDTQPAAAGYEDNAAIAITDAEWKRCVGFVQLTAAADRVSVVTGDLYCRTNLDLPYECVEGSTSLYVVIVARGTYTPVSGEVFTLRVGGEVN